MTSSRGREATSTGSIWVRLGEERGEKMNVIGVAKVLRGTVSGTVHAWGDL